MGAPVSTAVWINNNNIIMKNSVNCECISYLAVLELRHPPTGQSFQHGTQRYAPEQQRVYDDLQEVETKAKASHQRKCT